MCKGQYGRKCACKCAKAGAALKDNSSQQFTTAVHNRSGAKLWAHLVLVRERPARLGRDLFLEESFHLVLPLEKRVLPLKERIVVTCQKRLDPIEPIAHLLAELADLGPERGLVQAARDSDRLDGLRVLRKCLDLVRVLHVGLVKTQGHFGEMQKI